MQVVLSAKYNYPHDAAGIWCGLVFVAVGCLTNAFRNMLR